jgi:hypothetical protein
MQIDLPDVLAEVEAVFARYEDAFVNNKVDVMNELFWNDARTLRYGVKENQYGFEAIAEYRRTLVPNILQRTILRKSITSFGRDLAIANIEFRRADGETGRQSQTWVRLPPGWRIVAAHVSVLGN